MFDENIADWQSLTKLYGEMYDDELLELNDGIGDLTEVAQQVLRDEIKKRGLDKTDHQILPIADSPAAEGEPNQGDQSHEFTWKTLLCECNNREEAAPIR